MSYVNNSSVLPVVRSFSFEPVGGQGLQHCCSCFRLLPESRHAQEYCGSMSVRSMEWQSSRRRFVLGLQVLLYCGLSIIAASGKRTYATHHQLGAHRTLLGVLQPFLLTDSHIYPVLVSSPWSSTDSRPLQRQLWPSECQSPETSRRVLMASIFTCTLPLLRVHSMACCSVARFGWLVQCVREAIQPERSVVHSDGPPG